MISKEPVRGNGLARVTFELPSSLWAGQVNLVGEFNNWDRSGLPMAQDRSDGNWRVTIDLESGRAYRFRYLVDGQELLGDWQADGHLKNSQGSYDPVVDLTDLGGRSTP